MLYSFSDRIAGEHATQRSLCWQLDARCSMLKAERNKMIANYYWMNLFYFNWYFKFIKLNEYLVRKLLVLNGNTIQKLILSSKRIAKSCKEKLHTVICETRSICIALHYLIHTGKRGMKKRIQSRLLLLFNFIQYFVCFVFSWIFWYQVSAIGHQWCSMKNSLQWVHMLLHTP